ncbi:MAG: apolipoprotein N-acyltransferase [Acidobacteria bacterium]|nr:apolipoprotein N-acyltransferase [Acidobacteriota bacterium]MCG3194271.1 Apolipoprotein N-acyltransferase [Thermoanaerobaculia bacterium]
MEQTSSRPAPLSNRLLLAGFSAVLSGLVFPNFSIVWLLPVCLVPLFSAVREARPGRAFLIGWLFGTVFWLVLIPWIAYTVRTFGGVGWFLAGGALLVTAILLALPFGVMTWVIGSARPVSRAGEIVAWVAAWGLQEGLRMHLFGGFPWGLLAAPLADYPVLAQTASIGSVYLPSLLLVLVNLFLWMALTARDWKERGSWILTAVVVVIGALAFGNWRLANGGKETSSLSPLSVSLLQPGVSQERRWAEGQDQPIYLELMQETWRIAREAKPDLIIWPESATPYNWPWSQMMQVDLDTLCRASGTSVLLNTVWTGEPQRPDAPFFNSALLVTPAGPVLPVYSKQRLVPFGEYVPLGNVLRVIRPISRAVPESFSAGSEGTVLPLRDWKLGGAVCYEIVYPWIARRHVQNGATLLFTLTNDAWYGKAGARRQHWQLAVFRAIETGRPLLRVAATGISGWVDAWGRTRALLPLDKAGALTVTLGDASLGSAPISPPVAVRAGETIPAVCAFVSLASILSGYRRRRRESGESVRDQAETRQG